MNRADAHIVIKRGERPRVIKQYGIHYIIAPDARKAAGMWLELIYKEEGQ